jgi:hypothetical protein
MVPRLVVDFRVLIFLAEGLVFLLSILRKTRARNVVFGGHSVVLMCKIVALKCMYFRRLKVRHGFEIYF